MHVILSLQTVEELSAIMDRTFLNSSENGFKSQVPEGTQTRLEDRRLVCIGKERQSHTGLWGSVDSRFEAAGISEVKQLKIKRWMNFFFFFLGSFRV